MNTPALLPDPPPAEVDQSPPATRKAPRDSRVAPPPTEVPGFPPHCTAPDSYLLET